MYSDSQELLVLNSLKATVAVPQSSEAVSMSAVGTLSHSTVASTGRASLKIGSIVSSMVNVASAEIEFPQSSVNVNVTVSLPVAPQRSLSPILLFVTVALPELSVPVKLTNQFAKAPFGSIVPSHSTVISAGGLVQVGSSPSPN